MSEEYLKKVFLGPSFQKLSVNAQLAFMRMALWEGSGVLKLFRYSMSELVEATELPEEELMAALKELEAEPHRWIIRDQQVIWLHALAHDPEIVAVMQDPEVRAAFRRHLGGKA